MPVGSKIKEALREKGITQKKFADHCELPTSLLSEYLNDKVTPSVKFLYMVIDFFPDMDLNYLFRDDYNNGIVYEKTAEYETNPKKLIDKIQRELEDLKGLVSQK